MEEAADKMFTATADYVRTELNATLDEYQLLQQMNRAALNKYRDLTQTTQVSTKTCGTVELLPVSKKTHLV